MNPGSQPGRDRMHALSDLQVPADSSVKQKRVRTSSQRRA